MYVCVCVRVYMCVLVCTCVFASRCWKILGLTNKELIYGSEIFEIFLRQFRILVSTFSIILLVYLIRKYMYVCVCICVCVCACVFVLIMSTHSKQRLATAIFLPIGSSNEDSPTFVVIPVHTVVCGIMRRII